MPDYLENQTTVTAPGDTPNSVPNSASDTPPGSEDTAAGPPVNPEAYSLGLDELIASDQSLAALQIDQTLEADFRKAAHGLGLTQEAAGSLAQMYARHQARLAAENSARQTKSMQEAEAAWLAELRADKNFPAQLSQARAAIQSYGSPELSAILEDTRLGSHPAFVRFMASVGRALAEPAFAKGSPNSPDKSPAEVLYPNQGR